MIMSPKDVQNYKEYANSVDDLIKKCEKIVNSLTPEEANAKCNCIVQFDDHIITNKEHYEKYVRYIKDAAKEAKRQTELKENYYKRYSVSKTRIAFNEMAYIHDKIYTDFQAPPQMRQLVRNTTMEFEYRDDPRLRKERRETERRIKQMQEDVKKYTSPDEPTVGYAELIRRKAKANPPQTSLSQEEIARFDRMSDAWLGRWCHFSYNWGWVIPCLLLCLVANGGLITAIGLIVFMVCGGLYSWRVQEYCGVILPWYKDAGIMMEKRVFNKYFKK
nr:hypothetical protein [uncultured Blautia sp.]